jgi:hypothetical protein
MYSTIPSKRQFKMDELAFELRNERNYVAKYSKTFNRPATFIDKKKEAKKTGEWK